MDSLTHVVLGAALGEVTLGKRIGYKAMLIGALADTVPDFDVFANFFTDDEILKLQLHRAYTHSILTQFIWAFPFAWITYVLFKRSISYGRWYLLWILGLLTHITLDSQTTYGTQWFNPFSNMLVGFNNICVVDLVFTLPFMLFVIACLFMRKDNPLRQRTAWMGLGYAILYLCGTVVTKNVVANHFEAELKRQNIPAEQVYTSPAFFTNFLWSGIANSKDSVWLGEYSVLQKRETIKVVSYPRNTALVDNYPDRRSAEVLKWFSQDKYFATESGDTLKFYNVKWGRGDYRETDADKAIPFHFEVYPDGKGGYTSANVQADFGGDKFKSALKAFLHRITDAGDY